MRQALLALFPEFHATRVQATEAIAKSRGESPLYALDHLKSGRDVLPKYPTMWMIIVRPVGLD
jgi:hypothetical protein